jgi:hypothetical protein
MASLKKNSLTSLIRRFIITRMCLKYGERSEKFFNGMIIRRIKRVQYTIFIIKFVTQSRTGLQIYEGHDDQLNRPGPMA